MASEAIWKQGPDGDGLVRTANTGNTLPPTTLHRCLATGSAHLDGLCDNVFVGPVSLVAAAGLFSLRSCRRVCRRVGRRRVEAQRNRSSRCLRGTMPRALYLPE